MTSQAKTQEYVVPDTWFELLTELYDLHPIRTKKAYDKALEVLRALMRVPHRNADQEDYMKMVSRLVGEYEDEKFPIEAGSDPLGNLRFLMDQHEMNVSDLGRLLGNRSLGSLILNGHRSLSKAHIARLSEHFQVSPAVFF